MKNILQDFFASTIKLEKKMDELWHLKNEDIAALYQEQGIQSAKG